MKRWIISLFYLEKIKGKLNKKGEVKIKALIKCVHSFLFSYQFEIPLKEFLFYFSLSITLIDDKSLMQTLSVVNLFPKKRK
jgi:hypothetical protein